MSIRIAYCPLTGHAESSVPLMLADGDDDDDGDDEIYSAAKYKSRQCMHLAA